MDAAFLDRWHGVACLRFMDFQHTNNSEQRIWSDRPTLDDATFTIKGTPIELLCDLANRQQADAWFCIPHLADDDYVRQFARLVKEQLDPERKAYIEYSNEVWNGQFEQQRYAAELGQKLGFAEKPWENAWRYTAHRSVEFFNIWEEEFGGRDRLVRVLPSQAANSYVSQQVLGWNDAGRHADVLAIAPYISMNIPERGDRLTASEVATWSPDEFLDYVEANALPQCIDWMKENKAVADQYGLRGSSATRPASTSSAWPAARTTNDSRGCCTVNAHPRMSDIYDRYYAAWEETGGDLLCHFSSVGEWSKWGSWGLLQHADQDRLPRPSSQPP